MIDEQRFRAKLLDFVNTWAPKDGGPARNDFEADFYYIVHLIHLDAAAPYQKILSDRLAREPMQPIISLGPTHR